MSQASVTTPNADQIEFWNGQMGARWVTRQERLDAMLSPMGNAALARAAARPGEAVLDIGCGCGSTSLALAAQVGAAGTVFGVDISEPMLARARDRAEAAPQPKPEIRFQVADAQTASLGAPRFDLMFSRFGVMFFADPTAAFANIRHAIKPGGRAAFACWGSLDDNPWMKLPLKIAFQHVPPPPRPGPEDPGPFSFADPERVRRILGQAGFEDIALATFDTPLILGGTPDLDEAVAFVTETGPVASVLGDADEATRDMVRRSLREGLKPYHEADGVRMNGTVWVVSARNP